MKKLLLCCLAGIIIGCSNDMDGRIIPMDSMQVIMQKFKETGAWNLPVVKKGKYHGFISKSKLLTAYRRQLIEATP